MVVKQSNGQYTVVEGDTPRLVAALAYNDPNKYAMLLTANDEDRWQPGEILNVPDKAGRLTVVQADESMTDVLKRMFPGQYPYLYIDRFMAWNGGPDVHEGKVVFCPER